MFASLNNRTRNVAAVLDRVADELAKRSSEEWLDLFRQLHIPAMAIASPQDLLHDRHLVDTGFWVERETEAGSLRYPGIPTSFSATPGEIGEPAPVLGADSRAILAEAGLGEAAIDALFVSGAARE